MEKTSRLVVIILGGIFIYQIINYLTRQTEQVLKGGGMDQTAKLYLFYSDICPHCVQFRSTDSNGQPNQKSEWGKVFYYFQRNLKKWNIQVQEIETSHDSDGLSSTYHVRVVPTIIMVTGDGEVEEYDGPNKFDEIREFVQKRLKSD